jgi:hypothetical protein
MVALLLGLACALGDSFYDDEDGDGARDDVDCGPTDAAVHPGADELCNTIDDDCDLSIDEDPVGGDLWFVDADGDGHGDPAGTPIRLCEAGPGMAVAGDDCDDTEPLAWSGAPDTCNDGVDNDCDGLPAVDCGLEGAVSLASAGAVLHGDAAGDQTGASVSSFGDLDGDGLADLLVGAPQHHGVGVAYIVTGTPRGQVSLAEATTTVGGTFRTGQVGCAVAGPGDVDGDGLPDLLVGGSYVGTDFGVGAAYLITAIGTGEQDVDDARATFRGSDPGDFLGAAVAGAGDVDGDGLADLLLGAPGHDHTTTDTGAAYLYTGAPEGPRGPSSARSTFLGTRVSGNFGTAVASAGDVDGDGRDDLVVGAPEADEQGVAYLFVDPEPGLTEATDATATFLGDHAYGYAGLAVAGAGDIDGDGLADILVGAPGAGIAHDGDGAVYVLTGAPHGATYLYAARTRFRGDAANAQAGRSVAAGGDIDGDGRGDLIIGSVQGSGGGATWIVDDIPMGTVDLATASGVIRAGGGDAEAGAAVAIVGDVDGDARDDLLIGAPYDGTDGEQAGRAYVMYATGGP